MEITSVLSIIFNPQFLIDVLKGICMPTQILRWIGDEAHLLHLLQGFPTIALLGIIAICILSLAKGADWMIDGVVDLASRTGLPRIVIGATIVSLGTTMPEAFVSVMAAWMGNPGLALGNGVGSIIADTGLIFGLTCMLTVIPVNRFILNRTGWVQVGSATLLVGISLAALILMEGEPILSRWVGVLFLLLLGWYLYMTYTWAKQGVGKDEDIGKNDTSGSMGLGLVNRIVIIICHCIDGLPDKLKKAAAARLLTWYSSISAHDNAWSAVAI